MILPNQTLSAHRIGIIVAVLAAALSVLPSTVRSQKISSDEDTARVLAVENFATQDGAIRCEVRNKSSHAVRDVQLFIRYTWLWDDERHPGKTDPGTSTYYTLRETIQSGEKISFTYQPSPPLPKIAGGRFETSVKIAGFTEIIPQ